MNSLSDQQTQLEAFSKIVDSCLDLKQSDQLVVLYDESSLQYIESLTAVTVERSLPTTFLFLPGAMQRHTCDQLQRLPDEAWLPIPVEEALSRATGVLNIVSGATGTLPFRKAILKVTRSNSCRFAHVPGLSGEIIEVVSRSPFETILAHSELVAWAIGGARAAQLETTDSAGRRYTLNMDLGGWKNEPLMSPGLLFPGSWGNLPPGETFCCPEPGFVHGKVCISGSVPGHVIEPGGEVVLTFEAGRMVHRESALDSPALAFFARAQEKYQQENDPDWNLFAELGIGLNPAIPVLTGNSLYDEKVAGTVHVAIGENTYFGHNNKSGLHADMAILRPTLSIEGRTIVENGELRIDEIESMRQNWKAPERPLAKSMRLRLLAADIDEVDGRAYRRLCKAKRVGRVRMASDETARDLFVVTHLLGELEATTVGVLGESLAQFQPARLAELLDILQFYECIEVKP